VAAALLLMFATLLDHRAPPLNVIAMVGIAFLLWDPLALTDLGFLLSFGATAGILVAVPRWLPPGRVSRVALPVAGVLAATVAAEIALLPIQASAFHRITIAGLGLNLIAIPAMAIAQVGGMAIVAADVAGLSSMAAWAAMPAALGARALIDSAALVDLVPALTWRVASPPAVITAAYALACGLLAWRRWPRAQRLFASCAASAALLMALSSGQRSPPRGWLGVSMFDVGQGEAIAIRLPSGRSLLVDAGGPADRFDIGDRVVVPALLARDAARLDAFVLTHADADHAGGAAAVLADLRPSRVLEGIAPAAAVRPGDRIESLRAGVNLLMDGVLLRVLHPPPPDWERQTVRNDDSLVIELLFGHLSMLFTGDAGEAVEPAIAAQLSPAPIRILKAGHHGSRTSTSQTLVDAARPAAALISAGRGNLYGHPSPAVLSRLHEAGVEIFRTDRDGQIDVISDGRSVEIRTWSGRRWSAPAALQKRVDAAHDRVNRLLLRGHRPAADAAAMRANLVGLHER
jgi:competence protein ComEC